MKPKVLHFTAVSLLAIALTGCAGEQYSSTPAPSTTETSSEPTEPTPPSNTPDADTPSGTEVSIPSGAVAASADFQFPVPENWAELDPFAEEKVGKNIAMYASYEYPGEATEAAEHYKSLLASAGYQVREDPLGALTNQAAILVEGPVNDVFYTGNITFDSHADGTQRAVIHLTEDN